MKRCVLCGWILDVEHVFNVNCAAANAEAEQLEAEVRDAELDPGDPVLLERAMEVVREVVAYARFVRDLRPR